MTKKYRVLFQSVTGDGGAFKARMLKLGVPAGTIEELVRRAPLILKKDLTLGEARSYADAIQDAGGKVKIQQYEFPEKTGPGTVPPSITPLKDFILCPECGLIQPKGETCGKCGFRLKGINARQDRKNATSH